MRSVTFTLNQDTDSSSAPATITITEQDDGTLSFQISNVADGDNLIGDLRGLFFDVADDSLLGTLNFSGADITDSEQDGSVNDLGNGATINGVSDGPYEVGVEFGTQGAAGDDLQSTSFTLSSSLRGLTLDDISLENIAVRQTSVGEADGSRDGSDKLYGDVPYAVNAIDDVANVLEDTIETGNVFANDIDLDAGDLDGDGIADGLTVVAVDGDSNGVGQSIPVGAEDSGVAIVINADGSYSIDAEAADYLAEGETFTDTLSYTVDDSNGGTDTATITVNVTGVNDLPVALDDANTTDEATVVSGNVLGNDFDPDHSDVLGISAVNDDAFTFDTPITLDSGALVTMHADGSYDYDPNHQFDALLTGESASDRFTYQVSDGHGGFDTATVNITIDGIGDATPPERPWEGQDNFGTEHNKKGVEQAISNVVLYLQEGDDIIKAKIDGWDGKTSDLDDVDLGNFLDTYFADAELLAVSIKSGNNHNIDLGPGEGQLYLLDGDPDIDYAAGGAVPEPFTRDILSAHADVTFQYDASLFM
jgi:VCBS repeat-containing protein